MKQLTMIVLAFIMGFVIVTLLASTAHADTNKVQILKVKDIYNNVHMYIDKPVKSCKQVDVPIYQQQQGQGSLGDFLAGAIIGGAIGNNVSNADGAGAVGAIIGGAIANENAKKKNTTANIVGYNRETICETTVTKEKHIKREYMHTLIEFVYEGQEYRIEFVK